MIRIRELTHFWRYVLILKFNKWNPERNAEFCECESLT